MVLKIQRPGIRPKIEADMRLLSYLAGLAEKHVPQLAAYHPQKVVQQFAKSLQSELNFMTRDTMPSKLPPVLRAMIRS